MEMEESMEDVAGGSSTDSTVQCPVCALHIPATNINSHLDSCLDMKPSGLMPKKRRLSSQEGQSPQGSSVQRRTFSSLPPSFPVFQQHKTSEREETPSKSPFFPVSSPKSTDMTHKWKDIHAGPSSETIKKDQYNNAMEHHNDNIQSHTKGKNMTDQLDGKPLADKMRPASLQDYRGQDKVLGEDTMLRKLLQANDIPSIILWGPPGCGKVGGLCSIHTEAGCSISLHIIYIVLGVIHNVIAEHLSPVC